jgi:predicted ester cyclase
MSEDLARRNKAIVQRLVDDVINRWQIDDLEDLFTPAGAERARKDFGSFKEAFPDWQMELIEMVADEETVVARFKCRGTHRRTWMGDKPTGKTMAVDEVFFFRFRDGLIDAVWGLEDTWARKRQLGLR